MKGLKQKFERLAKILMSIDDKITYVTLNSNGYVIAHYDEDPEYLPLQKNWKTRIYRPTMSFSRASDEVSKAFRKIESFEDWIVRR